MRITNRGGKVTDPRGDYWAEVFRKGPPWEQIARRGDVRNFPRKSYSVWRLVLRALASAFAEDRDAKPILAEVEGDG
jgi:hypothetical protein